MSTVELLIHTRQKSDSGKSDCWFHYIKARDHHNHQIVIDLLLWYQRSWKFLHRCFSTNSRSGKKIRNFYGTVNMISVEDGAQLMRPNSLFYSFWPRAMPYHNITVYLMISGNPLTALTDLGCCRSSMNILHRFFYWIASPPSWLTREWLSREIDAGLGVQQGDNLWTLLFSIYIADLAKTIWTLVAAIFSMPTIWWSDHGL